MARKDLLKGLMNEPDKTLKRGLETKSMAPAPPPRYTKGAIGAVSQSIAELKSRAMVEIVADQIDAAGLKDRLEDDPEGHAQLMASLLEYGQQVPVLVRHDPNHEGRYQIVYGRRRVAALKELGLPVKALVRDLNDHDLIMAQGQENTARKDLSYIEKVNFARQMHAAGFERKVICDALNVDKTVISRMFAVAEALPQRVLEQIGAAPSIGRDRWKALTDRVSETKSTEAQLCKMLSEINATTSNERFEALMRGLKTPRAPAPPVQKLTVDKNTELGSARRSKDGLVMTFKNANGFDDWLAANIAEIHRDWKQRGE